MSVLAILGAGQHAKVVADAALCSPSITGVVFYSDGEGEDLVAGNTQDLMLDHHKYIGVVVGIGNNEIREAKYKELQVAKVPFATVIHPSAIVSASASIGEGAVVLAGVVVNSGAKITANCIINTGCIVEHDCLLNESVHLSPGVVLGGGVVIGWLCWIGIGVLVKNGICLASDVVVGVGGVVIADLKNAGVYVGVP